MKPDLMMLKVKDEPQDPVTASSQTAAGIVIRIRIIIRIIIYLKPIQANAGFSCAHVNVVDTIPDIIHIIYIHIHTYTRLHYHRRSVPIPSIPSCFFTFFLNTEIRVSLMSGGRALYTWAAR